MARCIVVNRMTFPWRTPIHTIAKPSNRRAAGPVKQPLRPGIGIVKATRTARVLPPQQRTSKCFSSQERPGSSAQISFGMS